MNYCQQKRINSAVRSAENKQYAMYNFISIILNNTLLKTESITTLQINIQYSFKEESFTKRRMKRRKHPYFGFSR